MNRTCIPCRVEYQCIKTGGAVQTMTDSGPYQLFAADIFECPSCHHQMAIAATTPMSEHFQPDFKPLAKKYHDAGWLYPSWRTEKEMDHFESATFSQGWPPE